MAIPQEIQLKIQALRQKYQSEDSKGEIDFIEESLSKSYEFRKLLENPIFKELASKAENKINEINTLLMNDNTLLNEKGIQLSNIRESFRMVASSLSLNIHDKAITELISIVDSK